MKQFTITISDEKVDFFRELIKSLSFVKEMKEETVFEVLEEQKAEVRERIEKYKDNPDNYLEWDDLENKLNQGE